MSAPTGLALIAIRHTRGRKTRRVSPPRWLGSLIYRCGTVPGVDHADVYEFLDRYTR